MEWNFNNDMPIYTQIMDHIKLAIASGQLLPGGHMATVRDMAQEAGVNPNTMQRALSELERKGLVYTNRTSGRFVTEDAQVIDMAKNEMAGEYIRSFRSSMNKLGYTDREIIDLLKAEQKEEN